MLVRRTTYDKTYTNSLCTMYDSPYLYAHTRIFNFVLLCFCIQDRNSLPDDVVQLVLEFLKGSCGESTSKLYCSKMFRSVCKQWCVVHDSTVVCIHVNVRINVREQKVNPANTKSALRFLQKLPKLKEMYFKGPIDRRFECLDTSAGRIHDRSAVKFANALSSRKFTNELTSLKIRYCKELSSANLSALSTHTALTHLRLSGCDNVDGSVLQSLRGLTNLTELNLHDCHTKSTYKASDELDVRGLVGLTALTSLNLGHNPVNDEGLVSVGSLSNLTQLELSRVRVGIGVPGKEKGWGIRKLSCLSLLTTLVLSDNKHINNTMMYGPLASLTALTYLDLRFCGPFSPDALQALRSTLTLLTSLNTDSH